jgi:hypothetical protein
MRVKPILSIATAATLLMSVVPAQSAENDGLYQAMGKCLAIYNVARGVYEQTDTAGLTSEQIAVATQGETALRSSFDGLVLRAGKLSQEAQDAVLENFRNSDAGVKAFLAANPGEPIMTLANECDEALGLNASSAASGVPPLPPISN